VLTILSAQRLLTGAWKPRNQHLKRFKRPSASQVSEALGITLNQEFDDYVATRSLPAADDRRARARYEASLRRMALAKPDVSVIDSATSGYPRAADEAAGSQRIRDLRR
jgi:hypothetical protein